MSGNPTRFLIELLTPIQYTMYGMNPKAVTTSRKSSVSSALASVRVEGLEPSKQVLSELDAYIDGKKTIEEIIQETKERYVALRHR